MTNTLLLASTSPRRIELLGLLGIPFKTANPNIDETTIRHTSPKELTRLLAEAKAGALYDVFPNTLIIGSDAVVSFQGKILEKPHNKTQQREMIHSQKGKDAEVYSSVCIINTATGEKRTETKVTPYTMSVPTNEQIEQYIATESGLDKAGGYGQQDENGMFVSAINGCYTNAIGFPLCTVSELLKQFGIDDGLDVAKKVMESTGKVC